MTRLEWDAGEYCCVGAPERCQCGPQEVVIRAVIANHHTFTAHEREWCLKEIDRIEGHRRSDYETEPDVTVALAVLSAWTDYCRDKGLVS